MVKKLLNKKLSIKFLTYAILAALLISLALLFRLGLYSVPWYDDYEYAKYTKSFQEFYGAGLVNAIRGACFQIRESWVIWQGTFSSIFFMALSPMGFNENLYFLGAFFIILLLTISAAVLMAVICSRIFNIKGYPAACIALSMSVLTVWRIYSANQAFYWYNSGIHYVGMHSFMMLFMAVLICLRDRRKPVTTVLKMTAAILLAVTVSGANFVTALQGILLLLGFTILTAITQRKKALIYIPVIAVYLTGMLINILAPGNKIRSLYYEGVAMSAPTAILSSFYEAIKRLWEFTGLFTIVFMIMLVPIIWKGLEHARLKFRLPGVFVLFAFLFYATSYTPNLYGTGSINLDRVINVAKITYQFVLIISEIYVVGWVKSKIKAAREDLNFAWLYAVCIAVLAVSFAVSPLERIRYSPYGAYYYVHTGEAAAYHDGYLRQVESIKAQGPDAVVDGNVFKPAFLCTGELSDDPEYEANRFMAKWYGKDSVAVRKEESEE